MQSKRESRPRILLSTRCIVLNKKGEILIIKRADTDRFPRYWEFPGGKLDKNQDVSHALEREVLEETGLIVVPMSRIEFTESEILSDGPYKRLPFVCITGIGKTEGSEKVILSKDHSEYRWVKKRDFFKYNLRIEAKKAFSALKNKLHR